MKLSENKDFLAFLKKNKVQVKNGMIPLDQADGIPDLFYKFKLEQAKVNGPPASVKALDKKGDLEMEYDHIQRLSQDEKKYNVVILEGHKNYDEDTWGGRLKGKASDIFRFLVEESLEDPAQVEDAIINYADDMGWTI